MSSDPYRVLGLPPGSDVQVIRRRYLALARRYHPDICCEQGAEERFKAINAAWAQLSDPAQKARIDASLRPRAPSGSRVPVRRVTHARPDASIITVSLAEAFRGVSRDVEVSLPHPCLHCGGSGVERGATCLVCWGQGWLTRPRRITISVPPGVRDGTCLRIAARREMPAYQAEVIVRLLPDATYWLDGTTLHARLDVSKDLAARGGEVTLDTPGPTLVVRIPRGTRDGTTLRLAGQGWPLRPGAAQRDDLLLHVRLGYR